MQKPTYKLETNKLQQGYDYIIGCDEVGRGCLAGPVVAAAVILNPAKIIGMQRSKVWYQGVHDSKLLNHNQRFIQDQLIKEHSLGWGIGQVAHKTVDKINIHNASLLAMHIAVQEVIKKVSSETKEKIKKFSILLDGKFPIKELNYDQQAIVDGDARVLSISAASIIAKVYRDNLMVKLHEKFPAYNFAQHKGYATRQHIAAIQEHGLCLYHRQTFCDRLK
jgi:ribonuclease HII